MGGSTQPRRPRRLFLRGHKPGSLRGGMCMERELLPVVLRIFRGGNGQRGAGVLMRRHLWFERFRSSSWPIGSGVPVCLLQASVAAHAQKVCCCTWAVRRWCAPVITAVRARVQGRRAAGSLALLLLRLLGLTQEPARHGERQQVQHKQPHPCCAGRHSKGDGRRISKAQASAGEVGRELGGSVRRCGTYEYKKELRPLTRRHPRAGGWFPGQPLRQT